MSIADKFLKQRTQKYVSKWSSEDFGDYRWVDKDLWVADQVPRDVLVLFEGAFEEVEVEDMWLTVEYWRDEDQVHVLLCCDGDSIGVNEYFLNENFEEFVRRLAFADIQEIFSRDSTIALKRGIIFGSKVDYLEDKGFITGTMDLDYDDLLSIAKKVSNDFDKTDIAEVKFDGFVEDRLKELEKEWKDNRGDVDDEY